MTLLFKMLSIYILVTDKGDRYGVGKRLQSFDVTLRRIGGVNVRGPVMRKILLLFASIIVLTGLVAQAQTKYIDPTGTYQLDSKTTKKGGDTYGYSGRIQVKKIGSDKIVMTFEVNKGAPSYNSGSFVDTLIYKDNRSIYTDPESDPTCKIFFDFGKKGVTVKEETADYNFGCGFGHAVVADGFYRRISNKTPILTEPTTGEELETK